MPNVYRFNDKLRLFLFEGEHTLRQEAAVFVGFYNRKGASMKNNKKAFTLIELLVVVLIIGILSAVALPQYTFAVEKARFAEAEQTVGSLQKAIDIWLLENGAPSQMTQLLGKNSVSGQLSLDFEGSLDCSAEDTCKSKNFSYGAVCGETNWCHVMVFRESERSYAITWSRNSTGWHGDECDYYTDVSPIGEKICKMLEKRGNGFFACENC